MDESTPVKLQMDMLTKSVIHRSELQLKSKILNANFNQTSADCRPSWVAKFHPPTKSIISSKSSDPVKFELSGKINRTITAGILHVFAIKFTAKSHPTRVWQRKPCEEPILWRNSVSAAISRARTRGKNHAVTEEDIAVPRVCFFFPFDVFLSPAAVVRRNDGVFASRIVICFMEPSECTEKSLKICILSV